MVCRFGKPQRLGHLLGKECNVAKQEPLLLTTGDAARELGISEAGVRFIVRKGELLAARRTVSGMLLYEKSDVLAVKKLRKSNARSKR